MTCESRKISRNKDWHWLLQWCIGGYLIFLFATVLIRSVLSGITYDEAYTYMHFGRANLRDLDVLRRLYGRSECEPNNHWLISFSIYLLHWLTREEYSEFVIRLPSLIFLGLYCIGVYSGYRRRQFSLTTLLFLVSNYYVLEFYGLARGYGMANTLVFFACMAYRRWENEDYRDPVHLSWLMIYMSLAIMANTIVLLLYPAFGILCLLRLVQHHSMKQFFKKDGVIFSLFLIFTLLMFKYHMNICSEGKPAYPGGTDFFQSVVLGYIGMFTEGEGLSYVLSIVFILTCFISMMILRRRILMQDLTFMLLIFIATNFGVQLLTHRGYITGRVLVAFYSFIVLGVNELYSGALVSMRSIQSHNWKRLIRLVSLMLCILLLVSVFSQLNLSSTRDWKDDYKYQTWVVGAELTGEPYEEEGWNAAEVFYWLKYHDLQVRYLEEK